MSSTPALDLELDHQLCFALYDASRSVIRAYGPLLSELNLTYPQYITMLVLWEAPDAVPVGAIGSRLHLDTSTLTPLLKRLESLELVRRERDPADERRVLVSLTTAGVELRERATAIPCQIAPRLGLDRAEEERLRNTLRQITRALDAGPPSP
ncbi:MarR family winged helix-turn-helix transcriptional regulator [Janibacter sp. GS2]|uniref:MarR family winged helix-turn-helix transcriptional regulator n=1 Tax=Janibacter sp. GS2 TaxID=3442646 RepID=UPI003EBA669B